MSGYRCLSDCNSRGRQLDPARAHTFVEIDHEIISTVILLPSANSFKKGCCQLQAKVCAQITGYPLFQACPGKRVLGELTVKLCIKLLHTSKGHNLILMISYMFRVILNCTMTSLTLCCLVMTLPISLCYLVLSVNICYWH